MNPIRMPLRLVFAAAACLTVLPAQPEEVEGALRDVRRTLPGGQESPRFLAAKAQWPEFERRIEMEIARQDAAARTGGYDLDQAVARYESMVVIKSDAVNHYLYGRALGLANRLEQARAEFDRAVALDPFFYWGYHGLGTYFAMRRMHEPASQYFSKCLELNPGYTRATRGLALCYYSMGRLDDAEATLRRILARDQNDVDTWISLGQVLMQSGRYGDAVDVLKRSQQLAPDKAEVQLSLARCYARTDQVDLAIATLSTLLRDPSAAYEAGVELAAIYERMGKNAEAADALQIALDNLPLSAGGNRDRLLQALTDLRSRPAYAPRDPNQKSWRDLVQDLEHGVEAERRRGAIRIIGRLPFRHMEIEQAVLKALYDKDSVVRTLALRTVATWWSEAGQLADSQIVNILGLLMKDLAPTVRGMAAWALGQSGYAGAVPILVENLAERNSYVFGEIHRSLNHLTFAYVEVDSDEEMTPERMARLAGTWQKWFQDNEHQYRRFRREPR